MKSIQCSGKDCNRASANATGIPYCTNCTPVDLMSKEQFRRFEKYIADDINKYVKINYPDTFTFYDCKYGDKINDGKDCRPDIRIVYNHGDVKNTIFIEIDEGFHEGQIKKDYAREKNLKLKGKENGDLRPQVIRIVPDENRDVFSIFKRKDHNGFVVANPENYNRVINKVYESINDMMKGILKEKSTMKIRRKSLTRMEKELAAIPGIFDHDIHSEVPDSFVYKEPDYMRRKYRQKGSRTGDSLFPDI